MCQQLGHMFLERLAQDTLEGLELTVMLVRIPYAATGA